MPMRGSRPVPSSRATPGHDPAREASVELAAGADGSLSGISDSDGKASISELRQAIARLAAERDHLRDELIKAQHRIASLERLADEDALTQVANRRAFVRQLARMIAFSHRYGVPASVLY